MAADDDIAALLPKPPPPRPDRRAATIGEALRRFDGGAAAPIGTNRPAAVRPSSWAFRGPAPIGALASIALIVVVGIPLALTSLRDEPMPDRGRTPVRATQPPSVVADAVPAPSTSPPATNPGVVAAEPCRSGDCARRSTATDEVPPPMVSAPMPAPLPASPPPPPPAQPGGETAVPEQRFAAADMAAPKPSALRAPAPVVAERAEAEYSGEIVVTGTMVKTSKAARRGDWNACTVGDPDRDIARCRGLVDRAAKGAAADRLIEGLTLAWDGDMTGAIAAFDAAIAVQPRNAFAYLNRGIARQLEGDTAQAAADLDRSIRYAPQVPRGYYNRSLILRDQGKARRADADAAIAVTLDSRYHAVVK